LGLEIRRALYRQSYRMNLTVAVGLVSLMISTPVFAQAPQHSTKADESALRLLNADEFHRFLQRLDRDTTHWQARLRALDIASLGAEQQERRQLEASFRLCIQALEHSRSDVKRLLENQAMKDQVLLLIDLDELNRDLDRVASALANPVSSKAPGAPQKSLGYAKDVLSVDRKSTVYALELQRQVVALAKLMDAILAQPQLGRAPGQK